MQKTPFRLSQHFTLQKVLCLLVSLIVIAAILGIAFTTYAEFRDIIINEVAASRIDVLLQISAKMGTVSNSVGLISSLYNRDEIRDILQQPEMDEAELVAAHLLLNSRNELVSQAMETIDLSYYLVLIGNNGFRYVSPSLPEHDKYDFDWLTTQLWYNKIAQAGGELVWIYPHADQAAGGEDGKVISIANTVCDTDGTELGTLIINVPERTLFRIYANVLSNNQIFIVESSGRIMSNNEPRLGGMSYFNMKRLDELVGSKGYTIVTILGEKYLMTRYDDEATGWALVEEIPLSDVLTPLVNIQNTIVLYAVSIIVVAILLIMLLSRHITQPLHTLQNRLLRVSDGDLSVKFQERRGWVEIRVINDACQQMVEKIAKLLQNVREQADLKRRMEIDFLRMQIKPHFMYNTLFSIKCLVALGENEKAENMLDSFSLLLRDLLDGKDEIIELAEEIEQLKKYIAIMEYRYGGYIGINIDIPETLLTACLPRFTLQPIVENCIFHGIEPSKNGGHIWIRAKRTPESILLVIADDGMGMGEEQLEKLRQLDMHTGGGIGLVNVHQRIRLHFGEEYGITAIDSNEGAGTRIVITLPDRHEDNMQ